jgi:hypothetical protein
MVALVSLEKKTLSLDAVGSACNPSKLGGRDERTAVQSQSRHKMFMSPYLK